MRRSMSLPEYSLLAISALSFSKVNAEVVYTNLDDVTIDVDYEAYFIDLNNDAISDFKFTKFSGTTIYTYGSSNTELWRFDSIRIRPTTSLGLAFNSIAGMYTSTYYSAPSYWPYALSPGDLIFNGLDFNGQYGREILASRLDELPANIGISYAGYWYPSVEDRYIGVHFRDIDNQYHYGWIRCSVLDSAEVLIIKDYAYETEINHPIVAGDTISYVGVENPQINDLATIYSFGSHVYIKSNFDQVDETINVTDMSGKPVFSAQYKNSYLDIDLSFLTTGNYIILLEMDTLIFSKQVFIQTQ